MDPAFKVEQVTIWNENLPKHQQIVPDEDAMAAADGALEKMQSNHAKILFEADSLALARDASQLAGLYQLQLNTQRAARLAKVQHLKEQNSIGAALIANFMDERSKHVGGPLSDLKNEILKDCMARNSSTKLSLNNVKNSLVPG